MQIKWKSSVGGSNRSKIYVCNDSSKANVARSQRLSDVQGPSRALFTLYGRMWGCTLTWPLPEKISMLCSSTDNDSDWKHISRVIDSRFIEILNKNDQNSEESLPVEAGRLPVLYPHPHGCLPIKETASGVPGNEVNKISAKSGKEFISGNQQKQAKIPKVSSADHRSCLCKGKSCLI